jgi:antirestriction protein ArdC
LAPQGYGSRYWLTFNQAQKLGGHIRKGEHSSIVTFWKIGDEKITTDAEGDERKSRPFLLRFYRVFNVEQTEGIADKLGLGNASPRIPQIDQCERIVAEMPNRPTIIQDGHAWYRPSTDTVGIPSRTAFNSVEEYYSTLFHELVHSTGNSSRVGREGIQNLNEFGSESYSKEELVAELGAALLCGVTGIVPKTIENSASYLKAWIDVLKSDSRMVVFAASQAQKAADYIQGVRA